jgi:hypothetical protein
MSMADSIRTVKAFSEKQIADLRYLGSLRAVDEWLASLVEPHNDPENPYYLHIDQFQILPPTKEGSYPVFTIYHSVYLKRGE